VIYMTSAIELAKYVVEYYHKNNSNITNLKLQKVMYYIQGYTLKVLGVVAFEEDIYHWSYGPVIVEVYYQFNQFRSDPIVSEPPKSKLPLKLKKVVDFVLSECFEYSAFTLVKKTHEEDPWKNTNTNGVMTVQAIRSYFKNNDPLMIGDKIEQ